MKSPHGIYYTPESVNWKIQAHGIESFLSAIGKNIKPGRNLYVTVTVVRETLPYKVGKEVLNLDCLKEITYTVHTEIGKTSARIFEAGIEIVKPNDKKSRVIFSSELSYPPRLINMLNFIKYWRASKREEALGRR